MSTDHSSPHVVFSTPLLTRSLRPKYFPQHPSLKHPHPVSLPHCKQPSFSSIQNNKQKYIFLPFNIISKMLKAHSLI
jgi:hypothetical protein